MPKYLLAIPAYNCEKQITRVLNKLISDEILIEKLDAIIIIDNQSLDSTVQSALDVISGSKFQKKFKVLKNAKNYGLGGSHKVAFLWAKNLNFDYVAILHGDDQALPSDLKPLIRECDLDPSLDAALGSRFMRGSQRIGYSRMRTIGNIGLNSIFTLVTRRLTLDLGSGLNIFSSKKMNIDHIVSFPDSLIFNIQLLLYFFGSRAKIKYVPISWLEEDQISNAKNIKIGMGALNLLAKWIFSKNNIPIRVTGHSYLTNEVSN